MSNLRKPLVIVVLTLVAVLSIGGAALGDAIGRTGKTVTAVRAITNDVPVVIFPEQGMIDVAGMKPTITVPATERAILVITFSADTDCKVTNATSANQCNVRVLVDNNPVPPGVVLWARSDALGTPSGGVRSMQWVTAPLNAGDHILKVQAQAAGAGSLRMGPMTLTVLRSKF